MSDRADRRAIAGIAALLLAAALLFGCTPAGGSTDAASASPASTQPTATDTSQGVPTMGSIDITVNGRAFSATLADTEAARQFAARLPVTLDMTELGGNEKYNFGDATYSTVGASVVSPIDAGDLMLYEDSCVVLFYETHDNTSYSYVPLAKVGDPSGLAEAAGSGSATVAFSTAK